jgi:16S rRNA (guanine966-N2)-methyltransferase
VRVIGGRSRGRRLPARLPSGVRPTSDRVREAIFDILGSLGGVEGLRVLDLFCGSGALGVEALSRGASSGTFVDRDARSLAAARHNLEHAGLDGDSVRLVRASLPEWLAGNGARRFDVAFCDPPYAFDRWPRLLELLPAGLAVLESDHELALPGGWDAVRTRHYGGTLVTVARRLPRHPELADS